MNALNISCIYMRTVYMFWLNVYAMLFVNVLLHNCLYVKWCPRHPFMCVVTYYTRLVTIYNIFTHMKPLVYLCGSRYFKRPCSPVLAIGVPMLFLCFYVSVSHPFMSTSQNCCFTFVLHPSLYLTLQWLPCPVLRLCYQFKLWCYLPFHPTLYDLRTVLLR